MNQKTLNIVFGVVIVVLIGAVVYFVVGKKSEPANNEPVITNNTITTQPTNPTLIPTTSKPTITGFETRKEGNQIVLYKLMSDGTSVKTGLQVPLSNCGQNADGSTFYCPENIVVSPDNTKAVYSTWKNVYYEIFVSNPDGTQSKKIAQQEVPEGSGGLNVQTLKWSSDGKFVTYQESGLRNFGTLPSGDPDFRSVLITYQVNIAAGAKVKLSEVEK